MYSRKSFLNSSDESRVSGTILDDFSALSLSNGKGRNGKDSAGVHPGESRDYFEERGQAKFQVDTRVLWGAAVVALLGAAAYLLYHLEIHLFIFAVLELIFTLIYNLMYYLIARLWEFTKQNISRCIPIVCGVAAGSFYWIIIDLDSVPAVQPPSPLSPKSKDRHRSHQNVSLQMGYITAIASGLVVTALMMFSDFL